MAIFELKNGHFLGFLVNKSNRRSLIFNNKPILLSWTLFRHANVGSVQNIGNFGHSRPFFALFRSNMAIFRVFGNKSTRNFVILKNKRIPINWILVDHNHIGSI